MDTIYHDYFKTAVTTAQRLIYLSILMAIIVFMTSYDKNSVEDFTVPLLGFKIDDFAALTSILCWLNLALGWYCKVSIRRADYYLEKIVDQEVIYATLDYPSIFQLGRRYKVVFSLAYVLIWSLPFENLASTSWYLSFLFSAVVTSPFTLAILFSQEITARGHNFDSEKVQRS